MGQDTNESDFKVYELISRLLEAPAGYAVLLCASSCLPPSPWTDRFSVQIDHEQKVVRLSGDLT